MNTYKKLIRAVESLEFVEDELAILGLTGKLELPIRDKLLCTLFKQCPEDYVAREVSVTSGVGKRASAVDLVVNTTGIELKAYIAADFSKAFMLDKIRSSIDSDLQKMYMAQCFEDMYAVLIVAIAECECIPSAKNLIRYDHTPSSVGDTSKAVHTMFPGRILHARFIPVGEAFGVSMKVGIFLIR